MKFILRSFSIFGIYMLLVSAICIEKTNTDIVSSQPVAVPTHKKAKSLKAHKLNFFQRLIVKFYLKKRKFLDKTKADGLASTSLWLGVAACGSVLLGLFVPYLILASIPTGIAAMITGGSALRNGTTAIGKAKTGKGLGLGALIAFGVILIAAVIIVSSWGWY